MSVIQGYLSTVEEGETDGLQIIEAKSRAIEQTIEEVKHFVQDSEDIPANEIDLESCLRRSIQEIQDRFPEAEIRFETQHTRVTVQATRSLETAFSLLLENAIEHGGDPAPQIDVTTTANTARINIVDSGPGLPAKQRSLLETGEIHEFDDPGSGFGLNLVRLIIEDTDGSIETTVDENGTTITIEIPKAIESNALVSPIQSRSPSLRPAIPHLIVTMGAAILAGIPYGIVSEVFGTSIAGIGVFYGAASPVVGWLTHEFHSIVFGFAFAGLIAVIPVDKQDRVSAYVMVGIGWALFLWTVAAGFVAPLWLRLLGIEQPIPSFNVVLLGSHLAWGVSLGLLTAYGYRWIVPRLSLENAR